MTDPRRAPTASGASQSRRAGPVVVCPEPPESRKSPFLKAHWGAIAAADFFTVEVVTLQGLVRHLVFFVIDLKTRRVRIAGIAQDHRAGPSRQWPMARADGP